MATTRRILGFAGKVAAMVLLLLAGGALTAGVILPRLAGATPYTVLSGSMAPTLPVGTLVVVRPSDTIRTGDLITFQLRSGDPQVATHRVVGVGMTVAGERAYITKGDANEVADITAVRAIQVRGAVWYFVPYLGYLSALFSPVERQAGVVVLAVGLLAYAGWQAIRFASGRAASRPRRGLGESEER